MTATTPIVSAEEVFAVNSSVRWVGLVTAKGEVVLNKMRTGVESYSPHQIDEEYLRLGPLTMLGVEERYSKYLKGVQEIVVYYGVTASVYARLGSQIIGVSIEKDEHALADVRAWLKTKRLELAGTLKKSGGS